VIGMSVGHHRLGAGRRSVPWLAAGLLLAVVACEPSAPPGFTGSVPPDGGASGAPGPSVAAPDASGLVAGQPTVTTDGGKVSVAGLGSGKTPAFDLPAGAAGMVVTPCSNGVNPFVTLYDAKDNKLGLIVDPTYTCHILIPRG
jgi:hypothetical protein